MDKIAKLKELLKDLTAEELEEAKSLLDNDSTDESSPEESEDLKVTENSEESDSENTDEKSDEETSEETLNSSEEIDKECDDMEDCEEEKTDSESSEEDAQEVLKEEDTAEEEQEDSAVEEDDIPKMVKTSDPQEEISTAPNIVDNGGEEVPVDYQQIIDAQNAKIAALEAEVKSYKSKIDGAFGYSSKPSMPAKVNRLYDDCSDVHIHR